jgi:hypothetical protein
MNCDVKNCVGNKKRNKNELSTMELNREFQKRCSTVEKKNNDNNLVVILT